MMVGGLFAVAAAAQLAYFPAVLVPADENSCLPSWLPSDHLKTATCLLRTQGIDRRIVHFLSARIMVLV